MKEQMNRRSFLGTTTLAAGSALGMSSATQGARSSGIASARRPNPIAVSTYSFWRFKQGLKMLQFVNNFQEPELVNLMDNDEKQLIMLRSLRNRLL